MHKIVISTMELLRISYLAKHDSLIRIKSNYNTLNITLDKFSKANARLEFGIDIEIEPNIDIIIKASDLIAATDNMVNVKNYDWRDDWRDFERIILEGSIDEFSGLVGASTICFDAKKIVIIHKNNEYTLDNIEIDFEKEYDVKKESIKHVEHILSVTDYLNIIHEIACDVKYIKYKGACELEPKAIYGGIVYNKELDGYDSYIEFEDARQAYKDFLEGMKPYYKINTTNNELLLLSESELRTMRYREVFSIEINVNSRGYVDKLRFRELKFRKSKLRKLKSR